MQISWYKENSEPAKDPTPKSHSAQDQHPTKHRPATDMCTRAHLRY